MSAPQPNNPLHGKTLESIVRYLVDFYGFEKLGAMIRIKCFIENPDVQSSLKFLRKTPWARKKVEDLFLKTTRS
ncbi:MAG: VF530 family protein [Bacteroidota bacterium]